MILAIRHFTDRKRPCIVLEEENKAVIIGYLTDNEREKWLRKAFDCGDNQTLAIVTPNTIFDKAESEEE